MTWVRIVKLELGYGAPHTFFLVSVRSFCFLVGIRSVLVDGIFCGWIIAVIWRIVMCPLCPLSTRSLGAFALPLLGGSAPCISRSRGVYHVVLNRGDRVFLVLRYGRGVAVIFLARVRTALWVGRNAALVIGDHGVVGREVAFRDTN